MKLKILGINTEFSSLKHPQFHEYSFCTAASISLLDYDCVVIDTGFISEAYSDTAISSYENKKLLSKYKSRQIQEDFSKIQEQIVELLNQGKSIILLIGKNENCYIHTGRAEYSGTGINARKTDIVSKFDMYSFLPVKISATHVYGESIDVGCQQPYLGFFRKVEDCHQYSAYFSVSAALDVKPLAKISGSSKVISAIIECGEGKIICLPQPFYEDDYTSVKLWKENGKTYLDSLVELCERVSWSGNGDNSYLPTWANQLYILDEEKELEKLRKLQLEAQKLQKKIEKQEAKIYGIKQYKSIIATGGVQLEEITKQVLSDIGFILSETERGRSDIIGSYGEYDIVAEIKGVNKSAAEKHAAQLEKWVAQFIEDTGRIPKAILIVNGFCDLPLAERTEEVFPDQMLKYCVARNHLLISTTQLLCLYIEIMLNPTCKEERLKELLETVGVYNHYTNVFDYIKMQESDTNTTG